MLAIIFLQDDVHKVKLSHIKRDIAHIFLSSLNLLRSWVQALIALGADVDASNAVGQSALMNAAEQGHLEIVEVKIACMNNPIQASDLVFVCGAGFQR